nr:unnamed protein product [Spirometra erinaceieuropaei]
MFAQFLFLTLAYGDSGQEEKSTLEFKQNSDYVYTKTLYGDVEYISVDGVRISKAADGSHCVAPNDCWEIIRPGRYVILSGFLKGTYAALVLKPEYSDVRFSVGVQYKSAGNPKYPQLRSGAVSAFAKEILKNERLIHIVLFSGRVVSISRTGNISVKEKKDHSIISVFGWSKDRRWETEAHVEGRPEATPTVRDLSHEMLAEILKGVFD